MKYVLNNDTFFEIRENSVGEKVCHVGREIIDQTIYLVNLNNLHNFNHFVVQTFNQALIIKETLI